ncbi:MAG: HAMP domain-containing histidine kinase [Gammaproteobacteria bacterium]|nr:HAMP domain-containing histidine kinase [Gammaproteobacteria bacterium]
MSQPQFANPEKHSAAPEALASTSNLPWRLLRLLNIYRLLVGILVVLVYAGGPSLLLVTRYPSLFLWTGIVYLGFCILTGFSLRARRPGFAMQAQIELVADIIAVVLLMHASGGPTSGLGGLLFVYLVAGSVLIPWRTSLAFAAVATLLILSDHTYLILFGTATPAGYVQVGLLGLILFIAALSGSYLGRRLRESEALALQRGVDLQNLAQLNDYIIRRMRTGVVVVDQEDRVRLINEAALANFNKQRAQELKVSELSPRLKQELDSWRQDNYQHSASFNSEDGKPVIPHFTQLTPESNAATLIFLEDSGLMSEQVRQMKLAALGRLTGSIAHEIRNPLAAISHANQLLAESSELHGNDRRFTEIIAEHSQRMERMVETILQLSRREATRAEELELDPWLRDFVAEFRDRQGLNGQSLVVRVETPEDVRVRVDPAHLYQIAWNLSENAMRYGQPAETDNLPLIEYRISPLPVPGGIELAILDRGTGVPEDIAEHLFEPFYTSNPRGTGLGLFIARELCECNRARLSYERRTEGGSCFRIQFGTTESWLT